MKLVNAIDLAIDYDIRLKISMLSNYSFTNSSPIMNNCIIDINCNEYLRDISSPSAFDGLSQKLRPCMGVLGVSMRASLWNVETESQESIPSKPKSLTRHLV